MVTDVPPKNRLARTLPSTFMASAPVLDMKILSPTDNICEEAVFEIPTFAPCPVVNAVVTLAKCGIEFETTLPCFPAESNVTPPKRDVSTPVSTTSFVDELYPIKVAPAKDASRKGAIYIVPAVLASIAVFEALNTIVFSAWSSVACLPNRILVDRSMVGMFLTILI